MLLRNEILEGKYKLRFSKKSLGKILGNLKFDYSQVYILDFGGFLKVYIDAIAELPNLTVSLF